MVSTRHCGKKRVAVYEATSPVHSANEDAEEVPATPQPRRKVVRRRRIKKEIITNSSNVDATVPDPAPKRGDLPKRRRRKVGNKVLEQKSVIITEYEEGNDADPDDSESLLDVDSTEMKDEKEPTKRARSRRAPRQRGNRGISKAGKKGGAATRRRRFKKPNVKDLSVTLGLEEPAPRLTKAQKVQLTEEDLHEQRYNDEVRKASNLEEVLRLANIADLGSDDDGEMCMETDIDDLDDFDLNEDPTCPKPLPKRERGSTKRLRNRQLDVTQDDVQEMCMVIKKSIRKSLITRRDQSEEAANDSTSTDDDDDEKNKNGKARKVEDPSNFIMFRTFRLIAGRQDEWLNKELTKLSDSSNDHSKQQLVPYQAIKHPITKQIYYEHLSWLAIAANSKEKAAPVSEDGVLAWLPSLQINFGHRYSLLAQNASPGSKTQLDIVLRITVLKAMKKLNAVYQALLKSRGALIELIDHVSKVSSNKRQICTELEQTHETLNMRSPRFDETSSWGLKPIRLALEPPYFKSEDGLMTYPMTPDILDRVQYYSSCFFKRDKQKWTTKDLQQLKICIKEALYSSRLHYLANRYDTLMEDCVRKYHMQIEFEGNRDDETTLMAVKRRQQGRQKKSELEYSSKYGIIFPTMFRLPNGITVRYKVNPKAVVDWRNNEEKSLKSKSYEELVLLQNEKIDWPAVANKMVIKSKKHRSAEDCELAWRHEVHPSVNDKRWGVEESRRLKEIYSRLGTEWKLVSLELNAPSDILQRPGRTPYQCFFRVRNRLDPPKKLTWTNELDKQILDKLKEYPGNWRLVTASIKDPSATKRQVIERYKKTVNPVLRNGAFTRVEDCLLILTIEKLKPFLAREGHFGCLLAYLPWRCETTWRDRANNLFSDWIVPWTLEEDKMLLQLAKTMNRNWQKISEEFTSFKNRKGCLTRYKILNRRLKDERFNGSLEAYHEAYAMTRYNVFQYKHLKEILELLVRVRAKPLPDKYQHFVGLLRDQEPTEVRLQHMLLTFDKDILNSAIVSLSHYVQTRDNYWRNWISKHGKRKRTFDRRTFHPENPQSVASALHIRGLELKRKEEIPNLSDFENEIYKFYARFKRTKALKKDADRPYIPDPKTLAQWHAVNRLIVTPVEELKDEPIKRKWKALKTNAPFDHSQKRRKLDLSTKSVARDKKPKTGETLSKRLKKKALSISTSVGKVKHAGPGRPKKTVITDENGFFLIPAELSAKAIPKKRGRPKKKLEELDPEFTITVTNKMELEDEMDYQEERFPTLVANADIVGNGEFRRRSSRPQKKVVDRDFAGLSDEDDDVGIHLT